MVIWDKDRSSKRERMDAVREYAEGKVVPADDIVPFLETVIHSGDKVALEGCNQKQAAFLAGALAQMDPEKVHGLNLIIPAISRAEHLDLFERGIAREVNFAYAGAQSLRLAQMLAENKLRIGAIHTYLELYARMYVDLTPHVCLIAADKADRNGNLYTGYNTEDTPMIAEAAAFKNGIVIAQVNTIVDEKELPRVDIPGGWIDYIVQAPEPYPMEPLFTRDPQFIKDADILMGMMVIKGIYAKHGVQSLNHGIGFNGAAIELLLPTYGEQLGLKGKICTHWVLNPHPTLIPAIEDGWVKQVCSFGGELGMEKYTAARLDVFFTGADGTLRSNRAAAQVAGLYGIDLFLGGTLQMDYAGNSSTVTNGRLSGYGGAPNMGNNSGGRRHTTRAWMDMAPGNGSMISGRKLVVQMMKSRSKFGPGRGGYRQEGGNGLRPRDDLRRGRDPCGHRTGDRLPLSGTERGGACPAAGCRGSGNPHRRPGEPGRDPGAAGRRQGGLPGGSGHLPGGGHEGLAGRPVPGGHRQDLRRAVRGA